MQFSNIFKELCSKKGITQKQALEEIGLARNANQKWKHGWPNSDTLKRIASYFGVTADSLLRDESSSSFNIAGNISNAAIMQGNANGPVSISNGGSPTGNELTDQESEVLRIFRALDMRLKNTVLTYLYEIEDQAKEKETKSGK